MQSHNDFPLLIYDGVCVFCSGVVQFIIRHERTPVLRFAPMQSDYAQRVLATLQKAIDPDKTFVLLKDGQVYTHSDAALHIAHELRWPWHWAWGFRILPRRLRGRVYSWVAGHRYEWFGRTEHCIIPTAEVRARIRGLD